MILKINSMILLTLLIIYDNKYKLIHDEINGYWIIEVK